MVGKGFVGTICGIDCLARRPHIHTKNGLALLQMVFHVDRLVSQRAVGRSGVEVRYLGTSLEAPAAGVHVPSVRVGQLVGVVESTRTEISAPVGIAEL